MKKIKLTILFSFFCTLMMAQVGHLMQGIGAVNMSMGGAATGQPLDISGAMHWNPAGLSAFSGPEVKVDFGAFFSSPTLYSTYKAPGIVFNGETEDDRGTSYMPALAFMWGDKGSRSKFGLSAFGISGFGVTFPEEANNPGSPSFNPAEPANPINFPQQFGGFGLIESNYMLLQVGFTWAYAITDNFSFGLQPTFNYSALELAPNPLAAPSQTKGYPTSDNASSYGYGGQAGLFYDSHKGIKLGVSYKSPQYFSEFEFENTYLDGSEAPGVAFTMDYPAIYSAGIGYSNKLLDLALDYRYVDYESTEGFEASGWQIADEGQFAGYPTGAVNGFGWENISVVSAGAQLKLINKLPLRFGYTYSDNPINEELTFFSIPATAIIEHAFQFGFSYEFSRAFVFDAVYHYGTSDGRTTGQMMNPMMITNDNPLGKIPESMVAYDMTTSMIQVGLRYNWGIKDRDKDGIDDDEDACPDTPGLAQFKGCPDRDNDGVEDSKDKCPDVPGLVEAAGCPDTDGDGINDKEDLCPDVAGLEQFNGCPDTDGDGVMDKMDACPEEAGAVENKGCPFKDADGDGVNDNVDRCPNVAGPASNEGCPEVSADTQKQLTDLARAIYFNTGKSTFTEATQVRMKKLSELLNTHKDLPFRVEGHTDNTGSDKINDKLSQERADAVMKYLIENGFPADKIRAVGYGSKQPISDNSTKLGRQENRRVDIFWDK